MAVGLIQLSDELNGFHCRAADDDPERKVYFQRDRHRHFLFLIFELLEKPAASLRFILHSG
jgi:hypothetical protein